MREEPRGCAGGERDNTGGERERKREAVPAGACDGVNDKWVHC